MEKDLIGKMMESLTLEQREQCIKTNKAYREMSSLELQLRDINELLEIAKSAWKRENRIWNEMISQMK